LFHFTKSANPKAQEHQSYASQEKTQDFGNDRLPTTNIVMKERIPTIARYVVQTSRRVHP